MSDPCQTCNGDPVYHGLGCPVCCTSPQPDTAPRMMQGIWPKEVGADTVDLADLPDTAPEGPVTDRGCVCWAANRTPPGDDTADHHHAGWCPVVDPQPDTVPEGPWTAGVHPRNHVTREDGALVAVYAPPGTGSVDDQVLADWVAAALNGAPATPAERAVIDAEREVLEQAMERPAPGSWQATRLSLAIDHLAGLRSERNKNDG